MMNTRRGYLSQAGLLLGAAATQVDSAQPSAQGSAVLPAYARAMDHECRRQSSFDTTGGNADFYRVPAGATQDLLAVDGPGVITHIWFTIASPAGWHLKELVLRAYWDGASQPSIEVPVGDFFGLNLGEYFLYQSAFTNCSSVKALNSYFAMPFRKSAKITVTNEGKQTVDAFYSNIDYQVVKSVPDDMLYFHAQYRQAAPNVARTYANESEEKNLDGEGNYVFVEAVGRGHLMGVTLGVVQNKNAWFGEGDDMTMIDGASRPQINGTGTEDYFCGAWDFGGRNGAVPFGNLYNGAPYIGWAERTNGRYCLYRWHADNPITFRKSLKHTIEHGHANDRGDNFYSVAYWYQDQPAREFPRLPALAERIPDLKIR